MIAVAFLACDNHPGSKEIVFVCTHGAARSPIAAAYFNKMAKERDLDFHAVFRGTEPDKVLTKETIEGLTNDGFEVDAWKPAKISAQDVAKAFKMVTFDCSVPTEGSTVLPEEWNGTPSIGKDYEVARNAIRENVAQFIGTLADK